MIKKPRQEAAGGGAGRRPGGSTLSPTSMKPTATGGVRESLDLVNSGL